MESGLIRVINASGTQSVPGGPATLIVPTLQRGNASQDALRPAVTQSVTRCVPTRDGHDQRRGRLVYKPAFACR